jgi:hypothetical protein
MFFLLKKKNNLDFHTKVQNSKWQMFYNRAPTTFRLEGEVTSLSESTQGEVERLLGEVNC